MFGFFLFTINKTFIKYMYKLYTLFFISKTTACPNYKISSLFWTIIDWTFCIILLQSFIRMFVNKTHFRVIKCYYLLYNVMKWIRFYYVYLLYFYYILYLDSYKQMQQTFNHDLMVYFIIILGFRFWDGDFHNI
jgi:hypothetical protein